MPLGGAAGTRVGSAQMVVMSLSGDLSSCVQKQSKAFVQQQQVSVSLLTDSPNVKDTTERRNTNDLYNKYQFVWL